MLSRIFKTTYEYHTKSTASVFKVFIALVLLQFALLSLLSSTAGFSGLPILEAKLGTNAFWWGLLGVFGSLSLAFENYIKDDKFVLVAGYTSAISSFILLSYDFMATQPPIHTGGILSITAGVFLGGILYGKVRG